MRVLYIEDEKDLRDCVSSILEEQGMDVVALSSSEGAIKRMNKCIPDIILLDQVLPGQNGIEFLSELKRHQKFAAIPVIMVTGVAGENAQIKALDFGADDYVVKPFFPNALAARIRAVARRFYKQSQVSELSSSSSSSSWS